MRNYLSFGGGVNSVAMMLLLLDEGVEFGPGKDAEALYVWMPDWPETHEYLMMLEEKRRLNNQTGPLATIRTV